VGLHPYRALTRFFPSATGRIGRLWPRALSDAEIAQPLLKKEIAMDSQAAPPACLCFHFEHGVDPSTRAMPGARMRSGGWHLANRRSR